MKKLSVLVVCLLVASFVFAGLPALSRLAEPKIVSAQDRDGLAELLTVVAKKVDAIPAIDGDFSEWSGVRSKDIGATFWKAVYTDDELAMYIRWPEYDVSVNSRGTWHWNSETRTWWQSEPVTRRNHPEWFSLGWDISSHLSDDPVSDVGCGAFCHEVSEGSGGLHHGTGAPGAYVDSWTFMGKHGVGQNRHQDNGWLVGVTSVSQEGDVLFNPASPTDPYMPITGKFTFVGYAEDRVFASADDVKFVARDTAGDAYCKQCHDDLAVPGDPLLVDFTYADPGDTMYFGNWDETYAAPLYIEIAPENWADCMVLTQAEIDAGEAVALADLSAADISKYWANYAALNCVVSQLVLKEPSGDQADIRAAATWENGYWTVELKRNLVTGSEYDVQFDDLSKDYAFGVTLSMAESMIGGFTDVGWTLRFEQ